MIRWNSPSASATAEEAVDLASLLTEADTRPTVKRAKAKRAMKRRESILGWWEIDAPEGRGVDVGRVLVFSSVGESILILSCEVVVVWRRWLRQERMKKDEKRREDGGEKSSKGEEVRGLNSRETQPENRRIVRVGSFEVGLNSIGIFNKSKGW